MTQASSSEREDCQRLADQIVRNWRAEGSPDAESALNAYPQLEAHRSVALDLIYEEYCLREEQGQPVDVDDFFKKYSRFRATLAQQIEVHQLLDQGDEWVQGLVTPKWPSIGEEHEGFRIVDELGRGGFSRVYLAQELALGNRSVAIKMCRDASNEAQILGRLDHTNIVPVHSVLACDDYAIICMPYVARLSLDDIISRDRDAQNPLTWEEILRLAQLPESVEGATSPTRRRSREDVAAFLFREIAGALRFAHKEGIVHLDIKPSNVLLDPDGRPRIVDFNLSCDINDGVWHGGGTVPYMSPEQMRRFAGDMSQVPGKSSDVYSLGVVMHELITGRHPYGPLSFQPPKVVCDKLMWRHENWRVDIPELTESDQGRIKRLLIRCLDLEPEKRPNMDDVCRELDNISKAGWRFPIRRREMLVLSSVFCVALAAWCMPSDEGRIRKARRLLLGGKAAQCVRYTSRHLARTPKWHKMRILRATAYERIAEPDLAIRDLRIVAQARLDQDSLWRMSIACARYGRYQEAENWATKDESFAGSIGGRLVRSFCNRKIAQYDSAIWIATSVLDGQPNIVPALHNRSLAYESRGRPTDIVKASKDIWRAHELQPTSQVIMCDGARILAKCARQRIEYYERAVQLAELVAVEGIKPTRIDRGQPDIPYFSLEEDIASFLFTP